MLCRISAVVLALLLPFVWGAANVSAQGEIAVQVLARINQARLEAGLPELTRSAQLDAAAQAHADDLGKNGVNLGHRGSDGSTIKQRIARAGYGGETTGENWAAYRTLDQIMNFWLNDPPHRRNILGSFREIGIGVASRANGGLIVITDFGGPGRAPEIATAPASVPNAPPKPRVAPTRAKPAVPKPTRTPAGKPAAKPTRTQPTSPPTMPTAEPVRVAQADVPQVHVGAPVVLRARGRIASSILSANASGTAGSIDSAGDLFRMALGAMLAGGGVILLGIAVVGHLCFRMR